MKSAATILLILALLFTHLSCTSETAGDVPDLRTLPEWSLTKELEITDSDEIMFNQVHFVIQSSEGDIIAADVGENHLLHFDQNGEFIGTIGRAGSGPGEFQSISSIYLTEDNKLHVFDRQNSRFTAFAHNGDQWEVSATESLDQNALRFSTFRPVNQPGTYLSTSAIVFMQDNLTEEPLQYVSLTDRTGASLQDSIAVLPYNFFLLNQSSGGGFSVRSKPNNLGLQAHFHLIDKETVIAARSDRFDIALKNIHTGEEKRINYPFSPVPLTGSDRQSALDAAGENFRSTMRESMPADHNIIRGLFPDDNQRIWLNMRTIIEDEEVSGWMIMDTSGEFTGTLQFPERFLVRNIQGERIAGIYRDEDGVPSIRVYKLTES